MKSSFLIIVLGIIVISYYLSFDYIIQNQSATAQLQPSQLPPVISGEGSNKSATAPFPQENGGEENRPHQHHLNVQRISTLTKQHNNVFQIYQHHLNVQRISTLTKQHNNVFQIYHLKPTLPSTLQQLVTLEIILIPMKTWQQTIQRLF